MLRNGLEPGHLLVLAIVVIILFGSRKLPDTARALGRSMRILKSEAKAMREEDPPKPAAAEPQPEAARVVQAAPGDAGTARAVSAEREASPNRR
ncbi:Sec-independent protein translocase subunit TatA [Embleya sp. AB8]|uniref:Sec-independent protein translocase subunit TatA n=1 Tax=Embleya sp. AB8 TaxID=3156304 RepID=UPI003C71616D